MKGTYDKVAFMKSLKKKKKGVDKGNQLWITLQNNWYKMAGVGNTCSSSDEVGYIPLLS